MARTLHVGWSNLDRLGRTNLFRKIYSIKIRREISSTIYFSFFNDFHKQERISVSCIFIISCFYTRRISRMDAKMCLSHDREVQDIFHELWKYY